MQSGSGTGCVLKRVYLHIARASGFNIQSEVHCEHTKGRTAASEGLSGASTGGAEQPECLLGAGLWQEVSRVGRDGMQGAPRLSGALLAQVTGSPELWQHGMSVWAGKGSCKPCWSSTLTLLR